MIIKYAIIDTLSILIRSIKYSSDAIQPNATGVKKKWKLAAVTHGNKPTKGEGRVKKVKLDSEIINRWSNFAILTYVFFSIIFF